MNLEALVEMVIKANQEVVKQIKEGNKMAFGFLCGMAQKVVNNAADPKLLDEEIKKQLNLP